MNFDDLETGSLKLKVAIKLILFSLFLGGLFLFVRGGKVDEVGMQIVGVVTAFFGGVGGLMFLLVSLNGKELPEELPEKEAWNGDRLSRHNSDRMDGSSFD